VVFGNDFVAIGNDFVVFGNDIVVFGNDFVVFDEHSHDVLNHKAIIHDYFDIDFNNRFKLNSLQRFRSD
jgi:hypothetical protein